MINIVAVADQMRLWVEAWHKNEPPQIPWSLDEVTTPIFMLAKHNYDLWHAEDAVRAASTAEAAWEAKRKIDALNQERNDTIELVDVVLKEDLFRRGYNTNPNSIWATETPGAAVDRLTILVLKIYHMEEQINRTDTDQMHIVACIEKLKILNRQWDDLVHAIDWLLNMIFDGRYQYKLYRQFKMYNDPAYRTSQ
jgi:hypothetical protein